MDHYFEEFTPAWNGNRESENPFTVEIKPMSRGDISRYAKMIHSEPVRGYRNRMKDNMQDVQERQFLDNVGAIKGLNHPRTGNKIETAKDLYDAPGMNALVSEIIEAMEDDSSLSEGLIKNSEPLSGGASKSRQSGGTVKAV